MDAFQIMLKKSQFTFAQPNHKDGVPDAEVEKLGQPVNLVDRNYLPNTALTENI